LEEVSTEIQIKLVYVIRRDGRHTTFRRLFYYTGRNIRNYEDQEEDGLTIGISLSRLNPRQSGKNSTSVLEYSVTLSLAA
jgi:hypothetical protein